MVGPYRATARPVKLTENDVFFTFVRLNGADEAVDGTPCNVSFPQLAEYCIVEEFWLSMICVDGVAELDIVFTPCVS